MALSAAICPKSRTLSTLGFVQIVPFALFIATSSFYKIERVSANNCVKQLCSFGHVRTSTLDRPFKIAFLALHLNIAFSMQ